MSPPLKLYYFNFPGKGETIRLLLNYGGIPYEEVTIVRETDWPKYKPLMPFGQLPVLEVEGKMINQSLSIARYVAKLVNLAGNDDLENCEIDSVVDTIQELYDKTLQLVIEKDEEKLKTLKDTYFNKTVPFLLQKLDDRAKENGGHLLLKKLTWADVAFISAYESITNFLQKNIFTDYLNLSTVKDNVLSLPAIKEYIKKRPDSSRKVIYNLKQDI